MRKFLPVLMVVAMLAMTAQIAFAAPTVGGYIEQKISYKVTDTTTPYTFGTTTFRVIVSGDASDSLSYYGRLSASAGSGSASIDRAFFTFKNVGAPGLSVKIGRQFIGWSRLNSFSGFEASTLDSVSLGYSAAPVSVDAYYSTSKAGTAGKLFESEKLAGRVSYSSSMGGLNVGLAGKVETALTSAGGFGYGVSGSVGMTDVGDVYAEVGQNSDAAKTQYTVVGANIGVLKPATGIGAWAEYDIKGSKYAFELNRDLVSNVNLAVGGDNTGGNLAATVTLKFSASF